MKRAMRSTALLLLAAFVLGAAPAAAHAQLEIGPGDVTLRVLDAAGNPDNRAGAHPDRFMIVIAADEAGLESEDIREVQVDFPPGLSGEPSAVPVCSRLTFEEGRYTGINHCPVESQVGELLFEQGTENAWGTPIYSVEPGPNEVATFGIQTFANSKLIGSLRRTDYGLSVSMTEIPQNSLFPMPSLANARFEFWGVPADRQQGTSIPRRPFLTTPTRCDAGPLEVGMQVRTWQQPARLITAKASTGSSLTGCHELPFAPGVDIEFGNPIADAPSGADLSVTLPHNSDPNGRVHSQIRDVSISLPEGTSFSPGVVSGVGVCTDAQLGLGTEADAACPPSSKVGSVELVSPPLGEPLIGSIYLGEERPGDRFRIAAVANARGTEIKLVGSLRPNLVTGRLVAQLNDLPQAAFSRLTMHFDGGPQALLSTPLKCGPATVAGTFIPDSGGPAAIASDAVTLGGPGGASCPAVAPFAPSFAAGVSTLAAGRPTAFSMTLRRQDREQLPGSFSVAFPIGLSASLASVEPCAMANLSTCGSASRIGSAVVEAGSGAEPAVLGGDIFLTGPYRRAPYGLVIVLRAILGPFDLGTITVRATLQMDSRSGQFTVQTDSLPTLVEGVPIRFQTIGLDIDRPGFMRNPTSCAPATVAATIRSTAGATAQPSSAFRVADCGALRFRPALAVVLIGSKELRRGGKPGLRIEMRSPPGSANLRGLDVLLPRAIKLDSPNVGRLCTRRDALAGKCPAGSQVGSAKAVTSLLDEQLVGSIYAAQPSGSGPPDLWAEFSGAGLDLNFRNRTEVKDGRLHTRLTGLPDLPFSRLSMSFAAGKRGLFSLRQGLCGDKGGARRLTSEISTEGHNGAYGLLQVPVKAASPKKCATRPGQRKSDRGKGQGTGRRGR
jgi:hypothetical protein